MMIQTQRLDYPDHREEIKSLNEILSLIEQGSRPLPENDVKAVEFLLARLDHLMTTDSARLKIYDQRESRI
jgi:hypothetical protein